MADVFSAISPAPPPKRLYNRLRVINSVISSQNFLGRCKGVESSTISRNFHLQSFPFNYSVRRKEKSSSRFGFSCSCVAQTSNRSQRRQFQGKSPSPRVPVVSEGRDDDKDHILCPGCGIFMQDSDPDLPGYYQKPENRLDEVSTDTDDAIEVLEEEEEIEGYFDVSDTDEQFHSDVEDESLIEYGIDGDIDFPSDWDVDEVEEDNEGVKKELNGFAPAGVGYGNITEENVRKPKEKISKSERKRRIREEAKRILEQDAATVCARCHSLRNYGQVKNEKAENLIPDFDFDRLISSRLMKPATSAPVVVVVVDCVDFDASFPKRAAKSLFEAMESNKNKISRLPKLILVATKVDLLPSQISPARLDRWVRNRAKANGAPKLNAVFLVSSRKDLGIRNLLSFIKESAGPRGNVWIIGAQNAGKSTLINTFAKKEGIAVSKLTEAAVPGTTLGILRIGGILPSKAKLYDTPGLLHSNLITMRLNREEQKMVEIRKELQPRTYRIKAGQTIHVGGLLRLDLEKSTVSTVYVTVCASPSVSLHMGKTENAEEIWNNHVGVRLQPPIGLGRTSALGQWKSREIKVSGISWEVNSVDISVAGLGWVSVGLKGEATFVLWTYDGVHVMQREPLILDRAPFIERPGFFLPKAISDALRRESKREQDDLMERDEDDL